MVEKSELIAELLKACQLPQLTQDLDSVLIESEQFIEFQKALSNILPALYDCVQQHDKYLFDAADPEAQQLCATLLVVLCEITAADAVYCLRDEAQLKHATCLLKEKSWSEHVVNLSFKIYQAKLQKNLWKRQLGATHGFLRFLEIVFNGTDKNMSAHIMNFCLAVALNIRECHDPIYKRMGIRIFQKLLKHTCTADIQNANVQAVIYDSVYKDVHFMDSVAGTNDIWQCLVQCLQHNDNLDSLNWSWADELIETLLRDIPIAPSAEISLCMLKYVTQLGYFFASNSDHISKKIDCQQELNQDELRAACAENNCHIIYRWAKSLLQLFVVESYKLKQSVNICTELLKERHCCFLVYIWPIPLAVIAPHLIIFYDKYTLLLMDVIVTHKKDKTIIRLIESFLTSCLKKLQNSQAASNNKLLEFEAALQLLLQNEIFSN